MHCVVIMCLALSGTAVLTSIGVYTILVQRQPTRGDYQARSFKEDDLMARLTECLARL